MKELLTPHRVTRAYNSAWKNEEPGTKLWKFAQECANLATEELQRNVETLHDLLRQEKLNVENLLREKRELLERIERLNREANERNDKIDELKAEVTRLEEDLGKELLYGDKLTGVVESVLGSFESVDLKNATEEQITTACQEAIDKFSAKHVDRALATVQDKLDMVASAERSIDALVPGAADVAKLRKLCEKLAVTVVLWADKDHGDLKLVREARALLVPKDLREAHDRLVDVTKADDGQAYNEARKYLERRDPIAAARL